MLCKDMFEIVKSLPFDEKIQVCEDGDVSIYLIRPSQLSSRFKNYDVNKNFQIFIKEGDREFRPNHLRVMIDLNLRVRCRPELRKDLLRCFDKIFYGEDPEVVMEDIKNEKFEHYLNSLKIISALSQLFIIEQSYGYNKESKFEPPTLFYQGWIREFIASSKEIDNLCMSVCRFRPPSAQYTSRENKKSKKYEEGLKELWYLE